MHGLDILGATSMEQVLSSLGAASRGAFDSASFHSGVCRRLDSWESAKISALRERFDLSAPCNQTNVQRDSTPR